jgi:predicted RNA-binding Zn ribbon-like protein
VFEEEPRPIRLMATIWADTQGVHDDFATPPDVDAWLDAAGIDRHGVATTPEGLRQAIHLRDSVRRLAALVTGDDRPAAASPVLDVEEAIATVNALAPVPRLTLTDGRIELAPKTGLALVAAEAQELLGRDSAMLRACYAPGCVLYFVKSHPRREWCSVGCGNRVRAARHYRAVRARRD